jgi:uncharacterized membrane protein YccC
MCGEVIGWVVTVLVVLRPNFWGTIERVAQRIGGTLIGGIIALGISLIIREREILFLALAFLAFACFSVRPLDYGVFTLVLTPLFMVLLDLANPGNWEINVVRIEDTLIGGLLALGGSYLLFPIWERELLPVQLARSISALREYFDKIIDLYRARPRFSRRRTVSRTGRIRERNLRTIEKSG